MLPFCKQPLGVTCIDPSFSLVVCVLIEACQRERDDKTRRCCLFGAATSQDRSAQASQGSSRLSLGLSLCQVATGEPSSLSTTTGPCSCGGAGRAGPPSGISLALPDRAYEATAWRQHLRRPMAQRVGTPLYGHRTEVCCCLGSYWK